MSERQYEWRVLNPTPEDVYGRIEDLVTRLAVASVALEGEFDGLRVDGWWAGPRTEFWFRTTEGVRLRGSVRVFDGGYRVSFRGQGTLPFRRHPIIRRLEIYLTS
jgi:hypothetical protein